MLANFPKKNPCRMSRSCLLFKQILTIYWYNESNIRKIFRITYTLQNQKYIHIILYMIYDCIILCNRPRTSRIISVISSVDPLLRPRPQSTAIPQPNLGHLGRLILLTMTFREKPIAYASMTRASSDA